MGIYHNLACDDCGQVRLTIGFGPAEIGDVIGFCLECLGAESVEEWESWKDVTFPIKGDAARLYGYANGGRWFRDPVLVGLAKASNEGDLDAMGILADELAERGEVEVEASVRWELKILRQRGEDEDRGEVDLPDWQREDALEGHLRGCPYAHEADETEGSDVPF